MFQFGTFQKIRTMSEYIDGFLTDREGWLLFQLARSCRIGCIVEIGSWQGKSTVWIGLGTQSTSKLRVYAIDPHIGSKEHQIHGQRIWTLKKFEENICRAGLKDIISPIVEFSENARYLFNQPISLLFIDGAHDYESVKKDYELWSPLVVDGGYVVFHDTQQIGVKRVADSVLRNHCFRKVYFQDTICCGTKVLRRSLRDKFRAHKMIELKNKFMDVCAETTHGSRRKRKWIKQWLKFKRTIMTVL